MAKGKKYVERREDHLWPCRVEVDKLMTKVLDIVEDNLLLGVVGRVLGREETVEAVHARPRRQLLAQRRHAQRLGARLLGLLAPQTAFFAVRRQV